MPVPEILFTIAEAFHPFVCQQVLMDFMVILKFCFGWQLAKAVIAQIGRENVISHWAGQWRWSTSSWSFFSPTPMGFHTPYRWPGSLQILPLGQLCCLQLPLCCSPPRSPSAGLAASCDFLGNTSEWKEMAIISYSYCSRTWKGFHGTNKRALLPPRSLCRHKPWRF